MIELTGRKDSTKGATARNRSKPHAQMPARKADQEIELICAIIRNGYHLGLSSRNRLSPRERFQFAVKLEEVCAIAEWMSRYVEHQEEIGLSEETLEQR